MFDRLKELLKHSAVYGLGGVVSRIVAVLLLPLYTAYLEPDDFGAVGVLIALSAVLVTVLRGGISSAFFRFYFDSPEADRRRLVFRTAFWFTMATSTAGLAVGVVFAGPIADLLGLGGEPGLVRAAFVGIWAQMNYEMLTGLFRVQQQSGRFVAASLVNIAVTIVATVLLVVVWKQGALGVIVGNFTGTLVVYAALLVLRRQHLGLQFDGRLRREMSRFGFPLVPSALALVAVNFSDRFFLVHLSGRDEVGIYEIGVRVASAMILLVTAFRTAWPAFAYSFEDDREARRTYGYVLTYVTLLTCWVALALSLLAPWLVRLLTTDAGYESAHRVVGLLAFSAAAFTAYLVVSIGVGRARRTGVNWVVTGLAAVLNVALNVILIPPYGMLGAAVATVAAYVALFLGMAWRAQRVYPVPYEWRRVATLAGVAVAIAVGAVVVDVPLLVAVGLVAAYPVALFLTGFYSPAERARIRRIASLTS